MSRVLVACEYSGVVRDAFLALGHDAMSCDLLPTESLGPHYTGDVRDVLDGCWDLMIAHPPCTHLSVSGARHFSEKRLDGRQQCDWCQGSESNDEQCATDEGKGESAHERVHREAMEIIDSYYAQQPKAEGGELPSGYIWLTGTTVRRTAAADNLRDMARDLLVDDDSVGIVPDRTQANLLRDIADALQDDQLFRVMALSAAPQPEQPARDGVVGVVIEGAPGDVCWNEHGLDLPVGTELFAKPQQADGGAVEWQFRLKEWPADAWNRIDREQYEDYLTGKGWTGSVDDYELRALYAAHPPKSPKSPGVTDEMVERACLQFWPSWKNPKLRSHYEREIMRECLLAALGGEK